jgi:hypothetical protein
MGEVSGFLYRVDQLAAAWSALETRQERLDRDFKKQAAAILRYLREHGARPKQAPGMLAALGAVYELAAIFARKSTVDLARARKFLKLCPRGIGRRALYPRIGYVVAPGAEKFLMREASARLLELFRRAVKTKKLAPRIRVRELQGKAASSRRTPKAEARKAA